METVTMTELIRQTGKVIKAIKEGRHFLLLYRGKPLGQIIPKRKPKDVSDKHIKEIKEALNALRPEKIISRGKRRKAYLERLKKEYGSSISRHKHPHRYL